MFKKLKNDINYEEQFNEEITKMIGNFEENLDITRSIYIYFDYERFGREIDMWYNDANDGNGFVQQASMGGAEFYVDGYHAWYHEPLRVILYGLSLYVYSRSTYNLLRYAIRS